MSDQFPLSNSLDDFSGAAALFPLPGAVFFPRTLFPLHIFEHRYRQMTADALNGDRLIAMANLKPGWELLSTGKTPPIFETVCLSRITAHEELPDGRYYLVLQGLTRAKISKELDSNLPYRIADLTLCPDEDSHLDESENSQLREKLLKGVQACHPDLAVNQMFVQALDQGLPLGALCDILSHGMGLPPGEAQVLLETPDVARRCRHLLDVMDAQSKPDPDRPSHFPPKFSRN